MPAWSTGCRCSYDGLETTFDYLEGFRIVTDHTVREAAVERSRLVRDYYDARVASATPGKGQVAQSTPYKPVPPGQIYLDAERFAQELDQRNAIRLTPFNEHEGEARQVETIEARPGVRWARPAGSEDAEGARVNVFGQAVTHIADKRAAGAKVLVTGWSEGSLDRLLQVLSEHGLANVVPVEKFADLRKLKPGEAGSAVLSLESGFETGDVVVIGEQDILGDRMVRRSKRRKRGADFITEVAGLDEGSIVVHAEHGIGRFVGLRTIEAAGAPHACLELVYADEAKLFLPVENIDLLSRYGGEGTDAMLDKLGGVAWQARKAKLKKRLLDMANGLIQIAAARLVRHAPVLVSPEGIYDEFAARFPYDETDDQANAIDAVREDLGAGRPMDRLVCGDVGFGKTEVALRAAFIAAMNGVQVAVVVPTTLLSRQHFKTFTDRFRGLPIRLQQASRLVGSKELALTKKELSEGKTDIVVGTHALLGSSHQVRQSRPADHRRGAAFRREAQGAAEGAEERRACADALGNTDPAHAATCHDGRARAIAHHHAAGRPHGRAHLHFALRPAGHPRDPDARALSRRPELLCLPAAQRPLAEIHDFLRQDVPELKVAVAHGQMPATELEDIMNAFYEGRYDVLLSTTIVESGLDVPTANTLIVHRADMFGLAQLYQLRGRVGRSKVRAFALSDTARQQAR
jgi:transcription-repair coupling factor (superfamily II helicase)